LTGVKTRSTPATGCRGGFATGDEPLQLAIIGRIAVLRLVEELGRDVPPDQVPLRSPLRPAAMSLVELPVCRVQTLTPQLPRVVDHREPAAEPNRRLRVLRQATNAKLEPTRRTGADTCARYLTNKAPYLDYPTALTSGWPIATGVIEGACRHLVKDRLDITGARWGLPGAEAILKLRAVRSNGDLDAYWDYHLAQEQQRTHRSRYADNVIPQAA